MRLREQVRRWGVDGIDIVQLREKGRESGDLFALAEAAMAALRVAAGGTGERGRTGGEARTRLVVNGRADVAAAAGADGVHLTSRTGELRPEQVRAIFAAAGLRQCLVSVSCHALEEVRAAREAGADVILYGPVFGKWVGGERVTEGAGLEQLRLACAAAGEVPVLALGGVTAETIENCVAAGAAGVAGIRLFGGSGGQGLGQPVA
ncbi:MAG: thiamine phosphate synthase [Janthinobacterium lividum]